MTDIPKEQMFDHREIAKAMMAARGIHDGFWLLVAQYSFMGISAGPSPDQVSPSALVGLSGIGLVQMDANNEQDSNPLCFNAAELNPGPAAETVATPKAKGSVRAKSHPSPTKHG